MRSTGIAAAEETAARTQPGDHGAGRVALPAWRPDDLGEALVALASKSGLPLRRGEAPSAPAGIGCNTSAQGDWIQAAAACLGIEVEPVELSGAELERDLGSVGPALLRLADGSFAAVLENGALLGPDLSIKRLPRSVLAAELREQTPANTVGGVDELLEAAEVPAGRRSRARAAIWREHLRDTKIGPFWSLRMPPGTSAWSVARRAGLLRRLVIVAGAHSAEYLLWIISWWLVGRGALDGRFDRGWLQAWALLLLTMVPFRALTVWLQGVAALTAGGLLKERLLVGALRMHPEEVRREGAGHLLGRVIESEALEALSLSGGLLALVATIELGVAACVLIIGAGGVVHAVLLAIWTAFTIALGFRYYRANRRWAGERLDLTHDLVERMTGHRTRVAQENPAAWHDREDDALSRYAALGRTMDGSGVLVLALAPRGWLIAGLLGLAPAFIAGNGSPATFAAAIGGTLLAWRALKSLAAGLWSLAGAAVAWQVVKPLFDAASRTQSPGIPELAAGIAVSERNAAIETRNVSFRYDGRPHAVLKDCTLRLAPGERVVMDGPSGSGKSTLGSLVAGLREPASGLVLAGGLDSRSLGHDGWRRMVACAPQFHENHVICAPFAFNLLMGRRGPLGQPDIDEAERICRELGLGDLLDRMPGGIMQMVGETGWQLSHGERGRLFIARAILQDAQAIVLDESFAALDPENLKLALDCIGNRARSALVIAHR